MTSHIAADTATTTATIPDKAAAGAKAGGAWTFHVVGAAPTAPAPETPPSSYVAASRGAVPPLSPPPTTAPVSPPVAPAAVVLPVSAASQGVAATLPTPNYLSISDELPSGTLHRDLFRRVGFVAFPPRSGGGD